MGCCRQVLLGLLAICIRFGAGAPAGGAASLTFHHDARGTYASYRLQDGETVWTHVVRRFTSRNDDVSDTEAVSRVLERSGIADDGKNPRHANHCPSGNWPDGPSVATRWAAGT